MPPSITPKVLENQIIRSVGYTELDRNGHMNNTRYLDWVDDLLPSSFHQEHPVKGITLCYLAEAREGQQIHLSWSLQEGGVLAVDAVRPDGVDTSKAHRIFAANLQFS